MKSKAEIMRDAVPKILEKTSEHIMHWNEMMRTLLEEYEIPESASDTELGRMVKAETNGVILVSSTRGNRYIGLKKYINIPEQQRLNIPKVYPFDTTIEATISFSSAIRIGKFDTQLLYELKKLYPEFDAEMKRDWSSRRRKVEISGSEDEIVLRIKR